MPQICACCRANQTTDILVTNNVGTVQAAKLQILSQTCSMFLLTSIVLTNYHMEKSLQINAVE